jgi:hypothetical protein
MLTLMHTHRTGCFWRDNYWCDIDIMDMYWSNDNGWIRE